MEHFFFSFFSQASQHIPAWNKEPATCWKSKVRLKINVSEPGKSAFTDSRGGLAFCLRVFRVWRLKAVCRKYTWALKNSRKYIFRFMHRGRYRITACMCGSTFDNVNLKPPCGSYLSVCTSALQKSSEDQWTLKRPETWPTPLQFIV